MTTEISRRSRVCVQIREDDEPRSQRTCIPENKVLESSCFSGPRAPSAPADGKKSSGALQKEIPPIVDIVFV